MRGDKKGREKRGDKKGGEERRDETREENSRREYIEWSKGHGQKWNG